MRAARGGAKRNAEAGEPERQRTDAENRLLLSAHASGQLRGAERGCGMRASHPRARWCHHCLEEASRPEGGPTLRLIGAPKRAAAPPGKSCVICGAERGALAAMLTPAAPRAGKEANKKTDDEEANAPDSPRIKATRLRFLASPLSALRHPGAALAELFPSQRPGAPPRPAASRSAALLLLAALSALLFVLHRFGAGFAAHFEPAALRATFEAAGPVGGVALYVGAFCVGELMHLPGTLFVAAGVLVWGCVLRRKVAQKAKCPSAQSKMRRAAAPLRTPSAARSMPGSRRGARHRLGSASAPRGLSLSALSVALSALTLVARAPHRAAVRWAGSSPCSPRR